MSQRLRVVVTGATGFVGSHILTAPWPELELVAACRRPSALPTSFDGEAIVGDLRDAAYRQRIADTADVVCHAASVAHFSGHAQEERTHYLEPTRALIEACKRGRARRFINLSATATRVERDGDPMGEGSHTGFWPHLDVVVDIEDALREASGPDLTGVNLRCGFFIGRGYSLGLLPALVPRLRTGLVPWVAGGHATASLISGEDIGRAFMLAATRDGLEGYQSVNLVDDASPSLRELLEHLHETQGVPLPKFSVPYWMAHAFGAMMEFVAAVTRTEPFLPRGIVHLLRESHATGARAAKLLGFVPQIAWQDAVAAQMAEMRERSLNPASA